MSIPSQSDDTLTDQARGKTSKDLADRLRDSYESWKSRIYEEGFKAGVALMQAKEKQV